MNDLHDRSYPVDQLAIISLSIFFKLLRFVSEYENDLIGGIAAFNLIGGIILSEVDPGLFGVIAQCVTEY
jgi:hypothetical protein